MSHYYYSSSRKFLLALVFVISTITSFAQNYWTPDSLPMVHLQDSSKYVISPDSILDQSTITRLDTMLRQLEVECGVQTVAVVVKHIEGDDPYSFGQAIADKYGIGHKKRDDGLFVMICTEDKSYTILTGKGLEGVLPDATCRKIEENEMIPRLKEQKWGEALSATIKAIDTYVRADDEFKQGYQPNKKEKADSDDDGGVSFLLPAIGILGVAGIVVLRNKKKREMEAKRPCHKCQEGHYVHKKTKTTDEGENLKYEYTYTCDKCGDTYIETELKNKAEIEAQSNIATNSTMAAAGVAAAESQEETKDESQEEKKVHEGSFGGGKFGGGGSTGRF